MQLDRKPGQVRKGVLGSVWNDAAGVSEMDEAGEWEKTLMGCGKCGRMGEKGREVWNDV